MKKLRHIRKSFNLGLIDPNNRKKYLNSFVWREVTCLSNIQPFLVWFKQWLNKIIRLLNAIGSDILELHLYCISTVFKHFKLHALMSHWNDQQHCNIESRSLHWEFTVGDLTFILSLKPLSWGWSAEAGPYF